MNLIAQPWSRFAEHRLKRAAGQDMPAIRQEVEQGQSALFFIPDNGYLIIRVEDKELVLVCFEGRNGHEVTKAMISIAKDNNLNSIRFHSSRQGAERYIKPLGFKPVETVYRLEL